MNALIIALTLFYSSAAFSHGGGEAAIEVGPGKGVTEVTKDKSFKLAPEAIKRLDIQTQPHGATLATIPKSAIVRTLISSQIFRLRNGSFKAVNFQIASRTSETIAIKSRELAPGDAVVVKGMGFLRMIVAQLGESEAEEEHSDDKNDEHGLEESGRAHSEKEADHHD